MQPIAHETDLDELRRGSVVYAVICAWAKLGLFQQFSNGPVPLSALPGDLRSIQVTARILGHAGLLTTDGERWGLSSVSTQMIDQGVLNIGGGLDAMRVLSGLDELGFSLVVIHPEDAAHPQEQGLARELRAELKRQGRVLVEQDGIVVGSLASQP